jgi:hypothetical protein
MSHSYKMKELTYKLRLESICFVGHNSVPPPIHRKYVPNPPQMCETADSTKAFGVSFYAPVRKIH